VTDAQIREKLARISTRPPGEWPRHLQQEFPTDPVMRSQALLWLHADMNGPEVEGAPPSLGEVADQRYELSVRLDSGASASVWKAFDRRLGRHVAIKVFPQFDESDAVEQVLAEARAASDVISEHVVRVLDVQYGDSRPYIVMELVSEYDTEKDDVVLGASASATKPRSVEEIARWVMQVARGVHEAHLRNVFHRDLKPKNVLITPNSRRARVADFGLAVSGASPDASHPSITLLKRGPKEPVSIRGTPEYMAPEQARGLPLTLDARSVDDRSVLVAIDVWGLGAIAYELLTGRPPWLARTEDDLSAWEIAASSEEPPRLTQGATRIPARLGRIVQKALATNPMHRYASAAAFANDLQDFLAKRPTTLDRSRAIRIALWCRRNPQLALSLLIGLALVALVVGTHASVATLRQERDALDREVAAQKVEHARINALRLARRAELEEMRITLAGERENLSNLGKSITEERASYQSLIEAKERSLRDANKATRQIASQLEAARAERKATEEARASLEKLVADIKSDADKAAKERDRLRREREASRVERDKAQKERDDAIVERDAAETQRDAAIAERDALSKKLRELKTGSDRSSPSRTPR
jgi:serine/threonine protein kinase